MTLTSSITIALATSLAACLTDSALGSQTTYDSYGILFGLSLKFSSGDKTCIGGMQGLINTSILFQYREATVKSDWKFLAEINSSVTLKNLTITRRSGSGGVQFRMLQLEHGGGYCNCWTLQNQSILSEHCAHESRQMVGNDWRFCNGIASKARGFISHTYYPSHSSGTQCPGNSGELISNKGSPLLLNCSTELPRM